MKKKTLSYYKKKLWGLTSEYVRRSGADENGYTSCVTCGIVKHWKELQAGHFVPQAQGNAVKFNLKNIHTQCYRCNVNLGGNGPEYNAFMLEKYGQETIDELRRLSKTTVKFTISDIQEKIEEMKEKLKEVT